MTRFIALILSLSVFVFAATHPTTPARAELLRLVSIVADISEMIGFLQSNTDTSSAETSKKLDQLISKFDDLPKLLRKEIDEGFKRETIRSLRGEIAAFQVLVAENAQNPDSTRFRQIAQRADSLAYKVGSYGVQAVNFYAAAIALQYAAHQKAKTSSAAIKVVGRQHLATLQAWLSDTGLLSVDTRLKGARDTEASAKLVAELSTTVWLDEIVHAWGRDGSDRRGWDVYRVVLTYDGSGSKTGGYKTWLVDYKSFDDGTVPWRFNFRDFGFYSYSQKVTKYDHATQRYDAKSLGIRRHIFGKGVNISQERLKRSSTWTRTKRRIHGAQFTPQSPFWEQGKEYVAEVNRRIDAYKEAIEIREQSDDLRKSIVSLAEFNKVISSSGASGLRRNTSWFCLFCD